MKVSIRDRISFQELNHRDVRAYLMGQGWQVTDRIGDLAQVFSKTDEEGEDWEIIVPLRLTVADYVLRMADVVATLAKCENRSELLVLEDLTFSGVDVIRDRAPHVEYDGTISVEAGVALHENAKALLLSAACATILPKATYHTGKFTEAVAYLNSVRFGQTARGSYVLTILSPVDPALNHAVYLELADDPFSRRVTRSLAHSLRHLEHAILSAEGEEGFNAFEQTVKEGISANLCEAVAGLVENGKGTDISLTWARTRPVPGINPCIQFTADSAGILREAAREFRKREPRNDVALTGWVVKLAREPDSFDGNATLQVLLAGDKKARNINGLFRS